MMVIKKNRVTKQEKSLVNVSSEETHYTVQCEDIRLITSNLKPLIVEEGVEQASNFAFMIKAIVDNQTAYSYLKVQVNHFISGGPKEVEGVQLHYVLMGTFRARQDVSPENLGDFVKMYTLAILWPYAREYASDQLRRAGGNDIVLPIINPQVVTEHIVENNLVEVDFIKSEEKEEK